jgi:hypothetical protein
MKIVIVDVKRHVIENESHRVFDLLKMENDLVYVRMENREDVEIRAISEFSEANVSFVFLSGILKDRQYTSRVVDRFSEPKEVEFEGAISLISMSKNVFESLSKGEMLCFDFEGTILNSAVLSLEAFIKHTKGFVYYDGERYSVVELIFAD